jgi:GMP synthase-like glutamine amidotransferase
VQWAAERGSVVGVSHLYRGDLPPGLDSFDLLVVMGGPMSVNDRDAHPWLEPELRCVREAVLANKRVLGVCLGAQLIAKAMGADVYPGPEKEIGWFPVRRVEIPAGSDAFSGFPEEFTPLHWHGETFDLAEGAVRLAETDPVPNQAFQIGRRAIGLQFHLEATPETVAALAEACGDEVGVGPYQQPIEELLDCSLQCAAVRPLLREVLDYLVRE